MKPRNPTQFYQDSTDLMALVTEARKLLDFWAVRYSMIVDNSHRAEDCPYALGAARNHLPQAGELEDLMARIHRLSADLLTQLPHTNLSAQELVEAHEVSHGL